MLTKDYNELLSEYIKIKPKSIPMRLESTLVFYCFISLLKKIKAECNLLELGVEKGGSALFLLLCMDKRDLITLVDQRRSVEFEKALKMIGGIRKEQLKYFVTKTNDRNTISKIDRKFDFIHIDAGHMYDQVYEDLMLYTPKLSDNGVLVMDDFFQPRLPGVTEAVYEYLFESKSCDLIPIVNCFNKLYLCNRKYLAEYQKRFKKIYNSLSSGLGDFKIIETYMKKHLAVIYIRGNPATKAKRLNRNLS